MQCWRQTVTNEAQTSEAEVINKGLIVEDHVGHVHANDLGEVTIPSMGTSSVLSTTFLTLCADLAHSAW